MKCSKCKVDPGYEASMRTCNGQVYCFCKFCSVLLNKTDMTAHVVERFLKDNSSQDTDLPLSDEDRSMLKAREQRASGKSPWKACC